MAIVTAKAPKPIRHRLKPAAGDAPTPTSVVTRRKPKSGQTDVPDMSPEEHRRRGEAADALFRELVRRATKGGG